jgi:hypothetical protein
MNDVAPAHRATLANIIDGLFHNIAHACSKSSSPRAFRDAPTQDPFRPVQWLNGVEDCDNPSLQVSMLGIIHYRAKDVYHSITRKYPDPDRLATLSRNEVVSSLERVVYHGPVAIRLAAVLSYEHHQNDSLHTLIDAGHLLQEFEQLDPYLSVVSPAIDRYHDRFCIQKEPTTALCREPIEEVLRETLAILAH